MRFDAVTGGLMQIGRLIVRLVIGGLFIGHGTQKLLGWFGGPGPAGTEQMMAGLKLHPPRRNALAAGATETAGGALLAAGLATPLAAASLIGVMLTAIRTVHLKNGPWAANGGYEYNLVLIPGPARTRRRWTRRAVPRPGVGHPRHRTAVGAR